MEQENGISTETVETDNSLQESETNQFELNDTIERVAKATSKGKKISVTHELNRPSLQDLQRRDTKQPYRSQEVEDEVDQVLADLSGKADIELYDKLIVRTSGYNPNISPEQTPEDRKATLNKIPAQHKISIVQDLTKVSSEVIYDDETTDVTEFVWSEDQTYRVRSEVGSRGEFVVYCDIKEPSYKQFEIYNGLTNFYIERPKGSTKKPVTRISVDLLPAVKLFDELVQTIDGLTFNGVSVDIKDAKQLASIDAYLKRSVVDAVMKETKLDMGE